MLTHTKSVLGTYFDHPALAVLYGLAVGFAAVGLIISVLNAQPMAAAFMAVYAITFAGIATLGYAILFLARLGSRLADRTAAHR